ncbi:hypothetical protein SAMN05421823_107176 [Catalinimonas alkaloidigena]|uniref:Uncharacterized protein n=1 Tax=Catalinimonas alkaloidigena TaxID=1075417 RepID=A0A1G9LVQ8_9BACT|nr:hypothetical protein SAMN05421823_107176 [Catalinimonas alkaloidigena]
MTAALTSNRWSRQYSARKAANLLKMKWFYVNTCRLFPLNN